jgi:hypothetical protein
MKKETMKRGNRSKLIGVSDLQKEYCFDYEKAKPNRFAGQAVEEKMVVILDSDVSKVFRSPESVNAVLRALIETMPPKKKHKPVTG